MILNKQSIKNKCSAGNARIYACGHCASTGTRKGSSKCDGRSRKLNSFSFGYFTTIPFNNTVLNNEMGTRYPQFHYGG